jgi:hypothetical protein
MIILGISLALFFVVAGVLSLKSNGDSGTSRIRGPVKDPGRSGLTFPGDSPLRGAQTHALAVVIIGETPDRRQDYSTAPSVQFRVIANS